MSATHSKHVFWLTLSTIFISTSGALGKYIDMPTPVIIWWRCTLAGLFLFLYCRYKKVTLKVDYKKDGFTFVIAALLMGAHWITYFYALKVANVAIGMLSLFTFPVITALLEPLFFKLKFDPMHIVLGILVLLGISILAPDFDLNNTKLQGVILGLLSSIFYALRNLILKEKTTRYDGSLLMFYQVAILAVILFPMLFIMDTSKIETEYPFVILLALLTTAIGHTMFINSFKYFKVSTASIIGSSQPIFGIIIAFLFLNEVPSWNIFLGGTLIILTVMIESIRSKQKIAR
ncbi:DMT family transporter [Sediminibacter sp. Hel_I_10]|uniref:DMT family transporter n=1 Tax=Sediminibacter sp. Hel_I_10 TaxID=1392490 RepID=UPI00047A8697|nr:DMT family transporter [Sediminibacter sp. Hel_I_10]